jgi:hypothetical protein
MEIINYDYPVQANTKFDLIVKNLGNSYVKTLFFTTTPPNEGDPNKFKDGGVFKERDGVKGLLGKSVFATVKLESEAYEIEHYNEKTRSIERIKMPPVSVELGTVLIDVNQSKNVVTTAINGLNGTIKEFISDGDYEVSLRGALVNEKGYDYPLSYFKQLNDVLKAPVSLKVTSEYLSLFPIHNLVVKGYTLPQTEGSSNTQLFEINALSDNPVELIKITA